MWSMLAILFGLLIAAMYVYYTGVSAPPQGPQATRSYSAKGGKTSQPSQNSRGRAGGGQKKKA